MMYWLGFVLRVKRGTARAENIRSTRRCLETVNVFGAVLANCVSGLTSRCPTSVKYNMFITQAYINEIQWHIHTDAAYVYEMHYFHSQKPTSMKYNECIHSYAAYINKMQWAHSHRCSLHQWHTILSLTCNRCSQYNPSTVPRIWPTATKSCILPWWTRYSERVRPIPHTDIYIDIVPCIVILLTWILYWIAHTDIYIDIVPYIEILLTCIENTYIGLHIQIFTLTLYHT